MFLPETILDSLLNRQHLQQIICPRILSCLAMMALYRGIVMVVFYSALLTFRTIYARHQKNRSERTVFIENTEITRSIFPQPSLMKAFTVLREEFSNVTRKLARSGKKWARNLKGIERAKIEGLSTNLRQLALLADLQTESFFLAW